MFCFYVFFFNRFRVLLTTIQVTPERVQVIVLACCVLHNMLRTRAPNLTNNLVDREDPVTHAVIPGVWRNDEALLSLEVMKGNNATKAAKAQREYLLEYLNSPAGSVSWQDNMI
jgi:hypothetical protein